VRAHEPTRPAGLSKSRVMAGLQCHKLLWWMVHEPTAPELELDDQAQSAMDRGSRVGEIARTYVPGGVAIDLPYNAYDERVAVTRQALAHKGEWQDANRRSNPVEPPLEFVAGLVRLSSSLASSSGGPTFCKRDHARFVVRPVVKNGRVEVGTIRPDERMNFVIDGDSVELIEVAQWTVELAF